MKTLEKKLEDIHNQLLEPMPIEAWYRLLEEKEVLMAKISMEESA